MAKNFKSQKTQQNEERWTNISGNMTLFANEYDGRIYCSTSVSRKIDENEYTNYYINVNLPKGQEPGEKGTYKINVKKGFISCYADRDGNPRLNIVVQEFDVID